MNTQMTDREGRSLFRVTLVFKTDKTSEKTNSDRDLKGNCPQIVQVDPHQRVVGTRTDLEFGGEDVFGTLVKVTRDLVNFGLKRNRHSNKNGMPMTLSSLTSTIGQRGKGSRRSFESLSYND